MQDFAPFTPELLGALSSPKTPDRTVIALCSWSARFVLQVEGPLPVVEGY